MSRTATCSKLQRRVETIVIARAFRLGTLKRHNDAFIDAEIFIIREVVLLAVKARSKNKQRTNIV